MWLALKSKQVEVAVVTVEGLGARLHSNSREAGCFARRSMAEGRHNKSQAVDGDSNNSMTRLLFGW
jgi:hypothetical protein